MKPSRTLATLACAAALITLGCDTESGASGYGTAEPAQQSQQPSKRKSWTRPPEMTIDTSKTYTATLQTNHGQIKVELFDDAAPKTVNNFVFLARQGFYDGTIFHRIIDNFMLQAGDPEGRGTGGPGYQFEDETRDNPHKHEPFTLSMANAGPNTNGSQFFITEVATPHLDGRHTVFGRVLEGQEVVGKISGVATNERDRPLEDVVLQKVTIEESGATPATRPATRPTTPAGQ